MHPDAKDDPMGLFERFFKYGVRPQWLQVYNFANFSYDCHNPLATLPQVQRIINVNAMSNGTVYLIKWKGLSYKDCTWEDKYTGIPDLERHIGDFEEFR